MMVFLIPWMDMLSPVPLPPRLNPCRLMLSMTRFISECPHERQRHACRSTLCLPKKPRFLQRAKAGLTALAGFPHPCNWSGASVKKGLSWYHACLSLLGRDHSGIGHYSQPDADAAVHPFR